MTISKSLSFSKNSQICVINSDIISATENFPDNYFSLIVTSPPYNLGKEYEKKTSFKKYLKIQERIVESILPKLASNGSVIYQIGNYFKDGELYPLDYYFYNIFKENGLILKNRIIWHFGSGIHSRSKFSHRYETLLWFVANPENYIFNLDNIRVPSKYPNKKYFKGPKKGLLSCNPLGKNPSDFWELAWTKEEYDEGIFEAPNVKSHHPEKTEHPCQFPCELVERCVLAFTNPNDVVLDPFSGSGTSGIAALLNNRRAVLVEKDKKYIDIIKKRVKLFEQGELKTRTICTPIQTSILEKQQSV